MSTPLLACEGLTCRFGGVIALDRVDFAVGDGEVLGLLGPNGAGKTSIIRVLVTLLRAHSGKALVCGRDVSAQVRHLE